MRYYVVECGYSHNFRFDNPAAAAGFMARAAEAIIVESRSNRESLELVIVDEPDESDEIQEDPELEEVSADDPSAE
jgi:hypothetical protein